MAAILTNHPPINMVNVSPNHDNGAEGATAGGGWFDWMPSWKPTSEELLLEAEKVVLSAMRSEYKDFHVPVGPNVYIHTIQLEPATPLPEPATPLVMIHGFGCGIPQYFKNYDHLHSSRQVYGIDLPGYGRSTRVLFTEDPETNEDLYVEYLEKWRLGVGLEKFILLGHSFGAFLSAAYAIKYPSHVRHLVLNDPWGFTVRVEEMESGRGRKYPMWITAVAMVITKFNPFTPIRVAGPAGPYLIKRFRADLTSKFGDDFMKYVYHSNAQDPTGENAFFSMQFQYGWALRPMLPRIISDLPPSVPISLIYGVRSWMDSSTGKKVIEARPSSYVDVHYIKRAGHHVHAEQPEEFNRVVNHICAAVDSNQDLEPISRTESEQEEESD